MIYVLLQNVLCTKIHSQFSGTLIVLVVSMKHMFQNLVQNTVYQSGSQCRSEPVYSDPLLKLVLFQFDTVSAPVVYRAVQILGIELSIFILINAKCN